MTTSKQKADEPFPQDSVPTDEMMATDPQSRYTLLLALLFLDLHSVRSVTAHHKDPRKKLLFVFMCWKGHPRTLLLCKECIELWSQRWFVWMGLGMLLKKCIIMIYISFPFLITSLILVNINLYFTWKTIKMWWFLYRGQQYQDNTSKEHVHESHIHIRPFLTMSDIRQEMWNYFEQFQLELRKNIWSLLKIDWSEKITISLVHFSKLIAILSLPNYHLIFNMIVSTCCFPAQIIWDFCMKLGEKLLCR